ncbi:MAG: DUF4446 family protein [Clostridiales bacterium]|uniref:DUF4446 family protein n=1 Tax=Roseburia sp. MSJ-14 TaxID=2841514 RepID=UPI0016B45EE1|nr:DUF4446 family protein [Roseburia sp. MSJ-14]MBU5474200.1 DUF4446 family protein [Roseburia sp. MSJ-14]NLK77908.1 DUF4446 family protein [Clostridiales bacterium]
MISEFLNLKFTVDDFLLTFAIMAGVMLLLLILLIINMVKTSKLKKKYNSFMVGKDAKSLEDNLIKRINQVEEVLVSEKKNEENIEKLFRSMKVTFQKVGMVKYDAFNEMGGKLSFSLALLDQKNDGFIINAVHSREGCYTYIKEIIDGNSVLVLAEEEKEALNIAMGVSTKKPE